MKKIILSALYITTLLSFNTDMHGMQKISELLYQGKAKGALMLEAIAGIYQTIAQRATQGVGTTFQVLTHLKRATTDLAIKSIQNSKGLTAAGYKNTLTFVQEHPRKSMAAGISLGLLGTLLISRTRFVQNTAFYAKQQLAYRFLRSHSLYFIDLGLRLGADINHRFENGKTALHMASEQGCTDIVKHLLLCNAHMSLSDDHHFKPIHYAAANGHQQVVQQLVCNGENIDTPTEDEEQRSPLTVACQEGQLEMVRWLVQHGANNLLETAKSHHTPRQLAEQEHQESIVRYLDQLYPIRKNYWYSNKLQEAITARDVQRAKIMINSGAQFNHTDHSLIPLNHAIGRYNPNKPTRLDRIAEALIKAGAPLDTPDAAGNTPLHLACAQINVRLARLFLDRGANGSTLNAAHETALNISLKNKNRDLVKLLTVHGIRLTPEQQKTNTWLSEAP